MLLTKLKIAMAMLLAASVLACGVAALVLPSSATAQTAAGKPSAHARKPKLVNADGPVEMVSWSSDGKFLATVVRTLTVRGEESRITGSALQIRDAATGAVVRTLYDELNVEGENLSAGRFSPDGKSVAGVIYGKNVVKLWDPGTGKEKMTFEGAKIGLNTIAFSRDSRFLASSGLVLDDKGKTQGMVILWDAGSGKLLPPALLVANSARHVGTAGEGMLDENGVGTVLVERAPGFIGQRHVRQESSGF